MNRCCREKKNVHCGICDEFPCPRVSNMGEFSDLHTNHAKEKTCKFISTEGFKIWYSTYIERADLLTEALEKYNDGRMKRYLCELFIQQDIGTIKKIMKEAETLDGTQKEIGRLFKELVKRVI